MEFHKISPFTVNRSGRTLFLLEISVNFIVFTVKVFTIEESSH